MAPLGERAGAEDDVSTQVLGRSARARILAARGSAEEAESLARDAVERSEATDDLNMRADTLVDLGEVLRTAGDRAGAEAALASALELYETKGNASAAEAARRRLAAPRAGRWGAAGGEPRPRSGRRPPSCRRPRGWTRRSTPSVTVGPCRQGGGRRRHAARRPRTRMWAAAGRSRARG